MSDFGTLAELDLVVSDESLRNVQKQIESELGAVEIGGVTDGGAMSAQAGGSGGAGASRRGRQSFQMERTRTDLLEEAVIYLEEIEDKVGGGDGGGAGGSSRSCSASLVRLLAMQRSRLVERSPTRSRTC